LKRMLIDLDIMDQTYIVHRTWTSRHRS
jgi:hypothetical protein